MLENYLEPEQLCLTSESFLAWYFKTGASADRKNKPI